MGPESELSEKEVVCGAPGCGGGLPRGPETQLLPSNPFRQSPSWWGLPAPAARGPRGPSGTSAPAPRSLPKGWGQQGAGGPAPGAEAEGVTAELVPG